MISVRETTRRYNSTVKFHLDKELSGVNCYTCRCGKVTKTIDVDAGTTPMTMPCGCGELAGSSFYKDKAPDQKPTHEWYRPTLKQAIKMRKKENHLTHVLDGGLDLREIA